VTDTPAEAHDRLQLQGRPALKIETIGHTDGSAVARSTAWFNADLTPELDDHLRHTRLIILPYPNGSWTIEVKIVKS
jgi:DNA-binding GntR family transcriptional regulator